MDVNGFALVAGGGSGIGLETVLTFAERGAAGVAIADKNTEGAKNAAAQSEKIATAQGYRAVVITTDVTDKKSVEDMVSETVKNFGRIDYFVNSVGIPRIQEWSITETDLDEFDLLHRVNSKGVLSCLQQVLKVMYAQEEKFVEGRSGRRSVGKGAVVNIASIAAFMSHPNTVSYTASKRAALGITQIAAAESARQGVRVNAVCPIFTETPMLAESYERIPQLRGLIQHVMPLQRAANVEEVASVAHFLASPAASYVNGQGWIVDSGVTLGVSG